jgi:hypothetical protein
MYEPQGVHIVAPVNILTFERILECASPFFMDLFTPKVQQQCLSIYRCYGIICLNQVDAVGLCMQVWRN